MNRGRTVHVEIEAQDIDDRPLLIDAAVYVSPGRGETQYERNGDPGEPPESPTIQIIDFEAVYEDGTPFLDDLSDIAIEQIKDQAWLDFTSPK